MIDEKQASSEYAKAIESMDTSVDTDIPSMQRNNREDILNRWNLEQAKAIASEEGIDLTDAHLQVIQTLRDYYREHGEVSTGRELSDMLDEVYADQGGKKYLRSLFAEGPVKQGMRIAGLPIPAYTEDSGFGVSR